MGKLKYLVVIPLVLLCSILNANYQNTIFEKTKIIESDIPDGYMYGQIPDFAKSVLKQNPWVFDDAAKSRLSSKIYPGGDSASISSIYMTILAQRLNPYDDDIVCYQILYRDAVTAKSENAKLKSYSEANSDRLILINKENLSIILFVDDTKDYDKIQKLADTITTRLDQ